MTKTVDVVCRAGRGVKYSLMSREALMYPPLHALVEKRKVVAHLSIKYNRRIQTEKGSTPQSHSGFWLDAMV